MTGRNADSRRRSASEWESLILQWEASGEELDRFCRRQGLRPATLRWWRWRLGGSGRSERVFASQPTSAASPGFAEVRLPELARGGEEPVGFELRWSDGLTLHIPPNFDEAALRRLLVVLEAAGC